MDTNSRVDRKRVIAIVRAFWEFILLGFALVGSAGRGWPQTLDDGKRGQEIFHNQCATCHSVTIQDARDHDAVLRARGPSLANSGDKFAPDWLEKWMHQPAQIWPAGYLSFRHVLATAQGDQIDEKRARNHVALATVESHQVAIYLGSLKEEPNQVPITTVASEIPGQVLFEKVLGCGSCHQAEPGHGGESGPELYTVSQRLKKDWVRAFIADPQYWGSGLMAKANIGGPQLDAIVNYLYQPKGASIPEHLLTRPSSDDPPLEDSIKATRAKTLYLVFCSQCHGIQGNGKGINSKSLSVAPRNHSSPEEMAGLTDDRLFAAIKFGGTAVGKSSLMPSWAPLLTDADINLLIGYLHKLAGSEVSSAGSADVRSSHAEGEASR